MTLFALPVFPSPVNVHNLGGMNTLFDGTPEQFFTEGLLAASHPLG